MQNKMRDIYNLMQARIDFRLVYYAEIMFSKPGLLKCMRCYKRSTESQERVYVIKQEGFEQLRQDDETWKKITRFIKNGGNELLSPLIGREALGSIRRRSSRRRRRRRGPILQ